MRDQEGETLRENERDQEDETLRENERSRG